MYFNDYSIRYSNYWNSHLHLPEELRRTTTLVLIKKVEWYLVHQLQKVHIMLKSENNDWWFWSKTTLGEGSFTYILFWYFCYQPPRSVHLNGKCRRQKKSVVTLGFSYRLSYPEVGRFLGGKVNPGALRGNAERLNRQDVSNNPKKSEVAGGCHDGWPLGKRDGEMAEW